jgi:predicted membrane GTPase involved in stress response
MEKEKQFLILSINYKIVVSFVEPNAEIYEGQVIGKLVVMICVNVTKEKQSNVRLEMMSKNSPPII